MIYGLPVGGNVLFFLQHGYCYMVAFGAGNEVRMAQVRFMVVEVIWIRKVVNSLLQLFFYKFEQKLGIFQKILLYSI